MKGQGRGDHLVSLAIAVFEPDLKGASWANVVVYKVNHSHAKLNSICAIFLRNEIDTDYSVRRINSILQGLGDLRWPDQLKPQQRPKMKSVPHFAL